MSTPLRDKKISPVNSLGNISAIANPQQIKEMGNFTKDFVELTTLLQTSLSSDEILAQFSRETNAKVPHDGFSYVNEKHDIHFILGETARHACTYQLTINEESLGIISLTRATPFTEEEIEKLERYLCTLHYPLRNALLYSQAVSAAHKDALTGIGNRAALSRGLFREIEMAHRHHRNLGILMIDIDHFKRVNDSFGHLTGDKVIQSIVHCLSASIRVTDSLYRYGGEEFVILLPETDGNGVLRLAKRIRRRVEKLSQLHNETEFRVTVSIGVANFQANDDEKSLLKRADTALYRCKNEGRNCIRIADPNKMEFNAD